MSSENVAGAVSRLLRAVGTDFEQYVNSPGSARFAPLFATALMKVQASQFLELASDLHSFIKGTTNARSFEVSFAEVVSELLGPVETRRQNLIAPDEQDPATRSGLAPAHLLSENDPSFWSISGRLPGSSLVAYWAELQGDEATRLVSHSSIELFANLSKYSVQFQYARELEWETLGRQAMEIVEVPPGSFVIFDGRAPHRHLSANPKEPARALVVQFSEGLLFRDPAALILQPPGDVPPDAQDEVPLSFGIQQHKLNLLKLVGYRLRAFRDGYGRTADDVARFLKIDELGPRGKMKKAIPKDDNGDASRRIQGAARVRLTRIEKGEVKMTIDELLAVSRAVDVGLRDIFCFPDEVVLKSGSLQKPSSDSIMPAKNYFFASSPAGLYDAVIVRTDQLATDDHFIAVHGDMVILALNTQLTLEMTKSRLHFRARAQKKNTVGVGERWAISPGEMQEAQIDTINIGPGEAAYFRGEMPHRMIAAKKGCLMLVGSHKLLSAHLHHSDKLSSASPERDGTSKAKKKPK